MGNHLWAWKYIGKMGGRVFQKTRIDHVDVVAKISASMHLYRRQVTQGHPFSILESPKHHPPFL